MQQREVYKTMDKSTIIKPSIGILLISTWKYNKFIDNTIARIRKYFFPNSIVKIFLHTDSQQKHDADIIIPIEHHQWPIMALFRYNIFNQHIDLYNTEYLFYLDIDTDIVDFIEEDILDNLVVVKHGCFPNNKGTPETNPQSTAYISEKEDLEYVCAGFLGGKHNYFHNMSLQLAENIKKDYNNNIIAIWHDESHLNRYIQTHKTLISIKFLPSCYMKHMLCNESNKIKMIAYSNEAKGFNKFENNITHMSINNKIILGIKTCVNNTFRQKAVRDTWLKNIDTNRFIPMFLIGKPNHQTQLINDILYLDCDDSYKLLYTKTLAYFNWVYHNTYSSHFWIVDDDSYINTKIFNAYNEYLDYDYSGNFIYGINKTNNNSGFTSGSGYCLSRNAVRYLLDHVDQEIEKTKNSKKEFGEDILVGDTLNSYMSNIKKLHINSIYPWSYCQFYKDLMIGHYVHINSGLSFEESMKKMDNLYHQNINSTNLVGCFKAKHIHWTGILSLYSDHTFYGGVDKPNGKWKIEDNNLILEWYHWGKEILTKTDNGYSNSELSLIFLFIEI